ncbi:hypothetical protein IJZ97_03190, partial [bacterium]|nr:hypothetical protein [bacterium]
MAQTVEELAELLDGIRLDAERNAENFDKILNTINNKLELISNDTETDDLIKVYLTELKKILEEKHTLMTSEFNKIENSFNTLKSEQESLVKTSDMKEMFEIFTTNMQSVAQELFTQKNLLAQYENNLEKFITDKTDKNDIVNSVTEIKKDVEIINHSFEKSISEINSNIQAIFKNLIVMDPTAQNDIVKRELENIYLSTNAILTGLHTIEQKDDDVLQHFNVLMEKLDNTAKTNDMESLANKTMSIEEKFNTLAQKTDFDNIQNSIEGFAGVLDGLKTLITSSNESHNTTCKQIDKLNSVLSTVVTENDFAGFRHDLADFIQKIIDNSSSLNENLNVNRETLQNLINEVKNYNLTSDFENILKSLNEIKTTAVNNADKIVNEISVVSAKVDSFSTEKVEQKLDSIEETFQDNILIASNSINTLRETSLDNANKIVSEIEKVSTQVGQFSTEPIENKVDLIDEKLSITSQDIKTIQTNIVEKLDNDEKFQAINNSIEFLQETVTSTQTANEASLVEKLLALRDMITSNVNSRDEKFQELHEQINKFVKNINKISSDAEMKLNNSLSEIVDMKLEVEQISKSFAELNFA